MAIIDKQSTNQVQAHDHDLSKSKQTRYTPPKLVKLFNAGEIEGKALDATESGTIGAIAS